MSTLGDLERVVADARASADTAALAEALVQYANALAEQGRIGEARRALDEAAGLERARGRTYEEARATHLAATLSRLEGDLDGAVQRAERALALAGGGNPVAVAAHTELGETALARRDGTAASQAYAKALSEGEAAGLIDTAKAALLRKRAIALAMAGRHRDAAADLARAYELLTAAGDSTTALRTLIEQATALQEGGATDEAARVRARAREMADVAGDHHAAADVYLLEAAEAVSRRDVDTAMRAARAAREAALAAVAPVPYVSAALTIAQLAEARGDRAGAYEALAAGWVTLGDLLGREVARATFAPRLEELRSRWGADAFRETKEAYEAVRRSSRST